MQMWQPTMPVNGQSSKREMARDDIYIYVYTYVYIYVYIHIYIYNWRVQCMNLDKQLADES